MNPSTCRHKNDVEASYIALWKSSVFYQVAMRSCSCTFALDLNPRKAEMWTSQRIKALNWWGGEYATKLHPASWRCFGGKKTEVLLRDKAASASSSWVYSASWHCFNLKHGKSMKCHWNASCMVNNSHFRNLPRGPHLELSIALHSNKGFLWTLERGWLSRGTLDTSTCFTRSQRKRISRMRRKWRMRRLGTCRYS